VLALPDTKPAEPSRTVGAFVSTLFEEMSQLNIRYCVLHSADKLPDALVSDLDLVVHPDDRRRLHLLLTRLTENGFSLIQDLEYAVNGRFLIFSWFAGGRVLSAAVDVVTEHRRDGLVLASAQAMLSGRRKIRSIWVSHPRVELHYLLAKSILKSTISHHGDRLCQLANELGNEQAEIVAAELLGRKVASEVVERCKAETLSEITPTLRRALRRSALWRRPFACALHKARNSLRLGRRLIHPAGLMVVVLGPDGAGKSTLLEGLVRSTPGFRKHVSFHWRPRLIGKRAQHGPRNGRELPPHNWWRSSARLVMHVADYCLGYICSVRPCITRTALVTFDRYYEDVLADPARYRYGGSMSLAKALRALIPRPDLILVLDASEEIILSRKQEASLEQIRQQRSAYLEIAGEHQNARVISAAAPPLSVLAEAQRAILDELEKRIRIRDQKY